MHLSPLVSRIAFAVLYGVIVFIIVLILGLLISKFLDASVGAVLTRFAGILGLLAGIVTFFGRSTPPVV
jgi:hypothetical protein